MSFILPSELTRARGVATAVATLVLSLASQAQAAGVPGQGTWETTLQGRDLDGDGSFFDAYYDTDLKITWLADASYALTSGYTADGYLDWDAAKAWVAQLNINGIAGWRLPDVKPANGSSFQYSYSAGGSTDVGYNIVSTQSELAHLYYVTLGNKWYGDAPVPVRPGSSLSNVGPFFGVEPSFYWSDVEYAPSTDAAWCFDTDGGYQNGFGKAFGFKAWAVHPGDVGSAVPEAQTCALALAGLAAALVVRRRQQR